MQINIVGKNIEMTPVLKSFVEEKLSHLQKRFEHIETVHVVLHIEHDSHIAEATVHIQAIDLHARAEAGDMYKAIDELAEKLMHQVTKYKEKLIDSHR